MASKIQSHSFYVAITPYKVDDSSADEFNLLNVRTAYDDSRKYFYVDLHAGWDTGWGGFGCILMGADDPLTGPKYVKVKDAPKNSQKTINEIGASLEQAKDAIAWLFDHREWAKLYLAVGNIARNGYTEDYRKQMEALINSNNKPNKEDENMRLNINNNSETKNVQTAAQVTNPIVSQVDVIGLMNGLKKNGTAKLSDYATPVEDAHAEEVESVNVGEVTVDSIMPVMQPVEGSEYTVKSDGKTATFESMAPNIGSEPAEEKPANTGRTKIVVAGVPRTKADVRCKKEDVKPQTSSLPKVTLKKKTPQTSSLPVVRLVVYTTKRGEQAPRIEGFGGENDPRWKRHYDDKVRLAKEKKEADAFNEKLQAQMKGKPKAEREKLRKQWKSVGSDPFGASYFTDRTTGDKYYQMTMGAKYMEVARELVDAYNSGDEQAIAAAEQAVIDCKNGIVKDIEAQRDAKRAEREAAKAQEKPAKPSGKAEKQAAPAMSDEEQAMFDLFKKFMAGDKDAMAKVGAVLNKAA